MKKDITKIGKFLRALRKEKKESMEQMARKLQVSAAFLSCVETGRKPVPNQFDRIIIEAYKLGEEQAKKVKVNYWLTKRYFKIFADLPMKKVLTGIFSEALANLDNDQCESIYQQIESFKEQNEKQTDSG